LISFLGVLGALAVYGTNQMKSPSRWRWVILASVVVAAVIAGVIGSLRPNPGITLTNLDNVEELRARFNQDRGTPRLLLLLSPT
jgi:hypothetical protein